MIRVGEGARPKQNHQMANLGNLGLEMDSRGHHQVADPVLCKLGRFRVAMFCQVVRGAKKSVCSNKQGQTIRRIFQFCVPGTVWDTVLPCPCSILQNIPQGALALVTKIILIKITVGQSGPFTRSVTRAPVSMQPFEVGSWTMVNVLR